MSPVDWILAAGRQAGKGDPERYIDTKVTSEPEKLTIELAMKGFYWLWGT
ncbi:hypothetical protein [Granulosicoccus antarcticus]|nr:hypothetical protein [Granulosicoccus antarcticus]